LYLSHYSVHTPLNGKSELVERYRAAPTIGLQANPVYAAMMESMDDSVGRVMQKLDALKLADNTFFVFTSDNGGLATTEGPKTPATNNGLRARERPSRRRHSRAAHVRWPTEVVQAERGAHLELRFIRDHFARVPSAGAAVRWSEHSSAAGRRFGSRRARHFLLALSALQPAGWQAGGRDSPGRVQAHRVLRKRPSRVVQRRSRCQREHEPGRRRARARRRLASYWPNGDSAQMPLANPDFVPDTQAADGRSRCLRE
jgi:hypothetical protein